MSYFSTNKPDCVFRIETGWECSEYYCLSFGSPDTLIEMTIDKENNRITEIECLYLGNVFHMPALILPPDRRSDPDLRSCQPNCFEDPSGSRLPCMVNLTRNELTLIFSSNCKPRFCHVHDRVEYYYSDKFDLLYIKVVDLTAEEFAVLDR